VSTITMLGRFAEMLADEDGVPGGRPTTGATRASVREAGSTPSRALACRDQRNVHPRARTGRSAGRVTVTFVMAPS
jgi:hypothetical protein